VPQESNQNTGLQALQKRLSNVHPTAAQYCNFLEAQLDWKPFQPAGVIGKALTPPSESDLYVKEKFSVAVSTKLAYEVPVPWLNGFLPGSHIQDRPLWDALAPWQPWASLHDPIAAVHVECTWDSVPLQVPALPDFTAHHELQTCAQT
jgi:hypothetical protein